MVATACARRRTANGDTMPITAAGRKNRTAEAANGPARGPRSAADSEDNRLGATTGIGNTRTPARKMTPAKTAGAGQRSAARPPATDPTAGVIDRGNLPGA